MSLFRRASSGTTGGTGPAGPAGPAGADGVDGEDMPGSLAAPYNVNDIEAPYYGFSNETGSWLIKNVTDTSVTWATLLNNGSVSTYSDAWTNRATLTYGRYDQAF